MDEIPSKETSNSSSIPSSTPTIIPQTYLDTLKDVVEGTLRFEELKSAQHKVYKVQYEVKGGGGEGGGLVTSVLRVYVGASSWWNLYLDSCPSDLLPPAEISTSEHLCYTLTQKYYDQAPPSFGPRSPSMRTFQPSVLGSSSNWLSLSYVPHTPFPHMIPDRVEFGFLEPHPRHGRLEPRDCLGYCCMVLEGYFYRVCKGAWKEGGGKGEVNPRDVVGRVEKVMKEVEGRGVGGGRAEEVKRMASELGRDYFAGVEEWRGGGEEGANDGGERSEKTVPYLPPVVVHCDLQPQNLCLGTAQDVGGERREGTWTRREDNDTTTTTTTYFIEGVVDYEEARFADPRFELMFMCRRVCCDLEQASIVWGMFSEFSKGEGWEVGGLEGWMKLECLVTLAGCVVRGSGMGEEWIKKEGRGEGRQDQEEEWRKYEREIERWGMFQAVSV
ncbi:hypothetical protein TrCOL_g9319 [Triparma columacea]|uniref:Aminoglycoside phosphotransferase domain-containing protein n=1 Tax=Triparma columacea TaxID=722753 RepID=A0A9W7GFE4_9STRA|nr:hypothetical protein TrCOL_g9319 [Triparma columacea]